MRNQRISGFIIGQRNIGEKDKLLRIYSRELGKISVIAKGSRQIKSKFTGHIETLNFIEALIYHGPKRTIITEVQAISYCEDIHKNLEKLKSVLKISEATDRFIFENQIIENLVELLEETLGYIRASKKQSLITTAYIVKLMTLVGMQPELNEVNIKEIKYQKLFKYLTNSSFEEIEKIRMTEDEKLTTNYLLNNIFEEIVGTKSFEF